MLLLLNLVVEHLENLDNTGSMPLLRSPTLLAGVGALEEVPVPIHGVLDLLSQRRPIICRSNVACRVRTHLKNNMLESPNRNGDLQAHACVAI
jgi:hypothetical protein